MKRLLRAMLAGALVAAGAVNAQTQGVTKDEIVLGTHLDLSGPAASLGKAVGWGMTMRAEEANAAGGIHGRKIRLVTEDSAYDPRKAVTAVQKLVNQDEVFAVIGGFGSAHVVASLPIATRKNVLHLFPITGAREVTDSVHPLVWNFVAPNFTEMGVVGTLARELKAEKVCILYQDDDFGIELLRGSEASLKAVGKELATRVSYKRGDTDFSSQVQRLAADKCEFVVLATIIRETVATIATARRIGFNPVFMVGQGAYNDAIPKMGGAAMEGLYASMRQQIPKQDDPSKELQAWFNAYKARFNEEPNVPAVLGYTAMDTFIRAATNAGKDLNNTSFSRAMETLKIPADKFGNPAMAWSATNHLGSNAFRVSQVRGGKWVIVKDYADVK